MDFVHPCPTIVMPLSIDKSEGCTRRRMCLTFIGWCIQGIEVWKEICTEIEGLVLKESERTRFAGMVNARLDEVEDSAMKLSSAIEVCQLIFPDEIP